MSRPIANINRIQFLREIHHGDKFEAKLAPVSLGLGATKLGYNVTALPPGKRASRTLRRRIVSAYPGSVI